MLLDKVGSSIVQKVTEALYPRREQSITTNTYTTVNFNGPISVNVHPPAPPAAQPAPALRAMPPLTFQDRNPVMVLIWTPDRTIKRPMKASDFPKPAQTMIAPPNTQHPAT